MFEISNMSPDKFAFFIPYKTRETTRSQSCARNVAQRSSPSV